MTTTRPTPGEPAELDALIALALGEHRAGRLAEAATAYRQVLALRPDIAEIHSNLGVILRTQGKLEQAAAQYRQALALKPDFVEAHNNLGNVLREQGKLDQAATRYQQAVDLRPDYADAHNNLGNVLLSQGKLDEAAARYQQALALKPGFVEAHHSLGDTLKRQGKLDQAVERFEQTIALRPDYAEAHNNLGDTLMQQGQYGRALACFEQALALRPDYADALRNLAVTLLEQLKLTDARQAFERLRLLRPDSIDAHLGLANCFLANGDYERGWPAYEGRMRMHELGPLLKRPRWTGEPLAGRSLLLVAEQGLGDTLHFVRYARLLKQRGARVILACPAALGRLFANLPDLDELFLLGSAQDLPRSDFYLPLLSAPGALGTTASTIPSQVPYLCADPELTDRWRAELAAIEGFKIGIAWQGSRDYRSDRQRSIPLAQFAPLASLPGVRLVSLQKGFGSEQIATVDFPVLDLTSRLDEAAGPFMDTAAVLCSLDLVVTPDTAVAHLAGALGVPVWIALQFSPEWRWLLDRDDSPWYPTMRLFRQTAHGQWSDVFERIANAVQARRSPTA